jgi:hypothetical protein
MSKKIASIVILSTLSIYVLIFLTIGSFFRWLFDDSEYDLQSSTYAYDSHLYYEDDSEIAELADILDSIDLDTESLSIITSILSKFVKDSQNTIYFQLYELDRSQLTEILIDFMVAELHELMLYELDDADTIEKLSKAYELKLDGYDFDTLIYIAVQKYLDLYNSYYVISELRFLVEDVDFEHYFTKEEFLYFFIYLKSVSDELNDKMDALNPNNKKLIFTKTSS